MLRQDVSWRFSFLYLLRQILATAHGFRILLVEAVLYFCWARLSDVRVSLERLSI
jgi:hypothetical protein